LKTLECGGFGMRESRIYIASGLCQDFAARIAGTLAGQRGFLLIDAKVEALHPHLKLESLPGLSLAGGEACKTLQVADRVLSAMAAADLDRDSTLIVVGGGSLGDLGGLVASLFLRGIDLIQVPSSLLSMVDSSVGGKTAVNLKEGKNLVGTFWPAKEVWIDTDLVSSLSATEFRSGMGEVLKIAIGLCPELFALLSAGIPDLHDSSRLAEIIALSLSAKISVVEDDPRELGSRRLLNLGHSLGHALECASNFTTPHGEAVVQGIFYALDLSEKLGEITSADATACRSLLRSFGYDAAKLPDLEELRGYLQRDKKMRAGQLGAVLPSGRGQSLVRSMSIDEFIGLASA